MVRVAERERKVAADGTIDRCTDAAVDFAGIPARRVAQSSKQGNAMFRYVDRTSSAFCPQEACTSERNAYELHSDSQDAACKV